MKEVIAMPKKAADLAEVVASLTPEEQGALPSRLRALVTPVDDASMSWQAAKADRDAAIEAAYALDPDEREAALAAAQDAWDAFKAAFAAAEG